MTAARPSLNPAYLTDILEAGGEPLVREVVATFLADAPRRLATVRTALAQADWDTAALGAHTIVSASSMLGLTAVSAAARRVEQVAMQHCRPTSLDLDALAAALADAREVLDSAVEALAHGGRSAR